MGDVVALVAAESREIAELALKKIKVDYEILPVVDNVENALHDIPEKVHEKGNVHWQNSWEKGNIEQGFAESDFIIENCYVTSRPTHAYLETESGLAYLEGDQLIVYCGSHAPYRDKLQIARATLHPIDKIRVISNPVGGAFGGKDEITLQIHLALLALKTRRPVKMAWSREESILSGQKKTSHECKN